MKNTSLLSFLLFSYFIIGPFYWFVGVSPTQLSMTKAVLLFLIVLISQINLLKKKKISKDPIFKYMFLALLMLCISSMVISLLKSSYDGLYFVLQIIISAYFLYLGVEYGPSFFEEYDRKITLKKFIIFLFFLFLAIFFWASMMYSPSFLSNPYIETSFGAQLHQTGFSGGRTGWSVGFGFLACFMFYFISKGNSAKTAMLTLIYLALCFYIISLPGGRSGTILFFCISVLFISKLSNRFGRMRAFLYPVILLSVFFVFYIILIGSDSRLIGTLSEASNINDFSNSRLAGYKVAITLIADNPLGYGFNNINLFNYNMGYSDVHNSWLKLGLELGVIPAILFLIILTYSLILLQKRINLNDTLSLSLLTVLYAGFYYSLFEPVGFLGNMQQTLIFWFSYGALISTSRKNSFNATG